MTAEADREPCRHGNGSAEGAFEPFGRPAPEALSKNGAVTPLADPPARSTAGLRQRIEELEATLEQRSRRFHQLVGEREQLRSLLAERDAEVQRLNRELGALGARERPAVGRRPALLAAMRALLEAWWSPRPRTEKARPQSQRSGTGEKKAARAPEERAEAALVPRIEAGGARPVMAVVLFGLPGPDIQAVLDPIERDCAERNMVPLLLTDNDAFELFRGRKVLFEFLPPRPEQERLAPELDWQVYTLRRLALISRKWRPVRVVAFGHTAVNIVRAWVHSPFEDEPLPASVRTGYAEAGFPMTEAGGSAQRPPSHGPGRIERRPEQVR